ncbi:MAG: nucleoside 2-deoxyribosyltransferase [Thermoanaerobaculum sp.]|nr:nucleoside 2-deoxyribosyltransferase [Thermoanaerobaculum sp.]MDW7966584.1 nucleoside 2-deoxyribosyltransferase [Thermoanaerobaculum sp.]
MRVYLACAMTNPQRDLTAVRQLFQVLLQEGHEVLTPHVVHGPEPRGEEDLSDAQLAQRDLELLQQADCVVAEVSAPSHGVGVEIALALSRGKPALALAHRRAAVSRLLAGLPGLRLERYESMSEIAEHVRAFVNST